MLFLVDFYIVDLLSWDSGLFYPEFGVSTVNFSYDFVNAFKLFVNGLRDLSVEVLLND